MKALLLARIASVDSGSGPLTLVEHVEPHAGPGQVRLRVRACGVCHTELDEIEGRTPPSEFPRILGHQVVGRVDEIGTDVDPSWLDRRVGVAWIFDACGTCPWCQSGRENLCPTFVATGRDVDGGYAEFMLARPAFLHDLPPELSDQDAAPCLCAGAIGFRSLQLANLTDGEPLGLTGFGASGHLVLAMSRVRYPRSPVYVFSRSQDERALARERGAVWTGETQDEAPQRLGAIIDTTPAWTPALHALSQLSPGGRLIINAIRKEDADKGVLVQLDYSRDLWLEKSIHSVANVTRADVRNYLDLAARHGLRAEVSTYPFDRANDALVDLKQGTGRGAKVLIVHGESRRAR